MVTEPHHPLVVEHGGGGPETAAHVSAWLRAVEADGSQVVVLAPSGDQTNVLNCNDSRKEEGRCERSY